MNKINIRSPYYITTLPKPTIYHSLQKCSDSSLGYISGQDIETILLSINDRVLDSGSETYIVIGEAENGTSVGDVTDSGLTGCEAPIVYYFLLQKCEGNVIGFISGQETTQITLANGDRVQDSSLVDYTVYGVSETGTTVGTITDTGLTGCPVAPPAPIYYTLTKCSNSSTGFISGQTTSVIALSLTDRVTDPSGDAYTVTGESTSGLSVGNVVDTGFQNCPQPPPPTPIQPQTIQVNCGDTQNVGTDVGVMTYQVNTPETGNFVVNISGSSVPQKFTLKWNGNEATTNYIGSDSYDADLLNAGVPQGEISTANPSNKISNLVTIAKSTSTPTLVELVVDAPLINDEFSVSFTCPVTPPVVIEQTTQINIWFDNSGSMGTTLVPLQQMVAGSLKDCLIQFYNNDSAEYDRLVKVREWGGPQDAVASERTFLKGISPPTESGATNAINIIFQDEAATIYHATGSSFNSSALRRPTYDIDIANFRSVVNSNPTGYITTIIMQVNDSAGPGFKQFLVALQNGTGNYYGVNGISDLTNVEITYNVFAGASYSSFPNFYRDLIIQSINDLGFSITCP